jgi:tetratricopeptide (TPR) repeat protein
MDARQDAIANRDFGSEARQDRVSDRLDTRQDSTPGDNRQERIEGRQERIEGREGGSEARQERVDQRLEGRQENISNRQDGDFQAGDNRQDWMNQRMDSRQERIENRDWGSEARQDRVVNRIENRQQNINDRIDFRQERRDYLKEDLQNRWDYWQDHGHPPGYHPPGYWGWHGWAHGYWGSGAWWDHMWEYHPAAMAVGMTRWGINRLAYGLGYAGYGNPYYSEGGGGGGGGSYPVDYSEPLSYYDDQTTANPPTETEQQTAVGVFDQARQDFYDGKYDAAFVGVNKALATMPGDPVMNEFRALVLFMQGKYKEAAANIHSVLAVGPGWDWTTLASLFPGNSVYTAQLQKLEDFVIANPNSAAERFLLAYHYMTEGHKEAAAKHFHKVRELQPDDGVALQMLEVLEGPQQSPGTAPPTPNVEPQIPEADLVGTWTASKGSGAAFTLVLDDAGKFTWTYKEGDKETIAEGVYALEGNTLAMEPDAGGVMAAEITAPKDGKFHFQIPGAPPGDQGLDFMKK